MCCCLITGCQHEPVSGSVYCKYHESEETIKEINKNISMEEDFLEDMMSDSGLDKSETNEIIQDILSNLDELYEKLELYTQ